MTKRRNTMLYTNVCLGNQTVLFTSEKKRKSKTKTDDDEDEEEKEEEEVVILHVHLALALFIDCALYLKIRPELLCTLRQGWTLWSERASQPQIKSVSYPLAVHYL